MAAPGHPSILLIGPTGAGKSPLGDELERRGLADRVCVHFDFGAELRRPAAGCPPMFDSGLTEAEREAVRRSLETGDLFEDKDMPMVLKILDDFIKRRKSSPQTLLILNGLPRHVEQAKALSGRIAIEAVVELRAEARVILERIRLDTGGDRSQRPDDSLGAVERRLALYRERTIPLVRFYRRRGAPILSIDVTERMSAARMREILERRLG